MLRIKMSAGKKIFRLSIFAIIFAALLASVFFGCGGLKDRADEVEFHDYFNEFRLNLKLQVRNIADDTVGQFLYSHFDTDQSLGEIKNIVDGMNSADSVRLSGAINPDNIVKYKTEMIAGTAAGDMLFIEAGSVSSPKSYFILGRTPGTEKNITLLNMRATLRDADKGTRDFLLPYHFCTFSETDAYYNPEYYGLYRVIIDGSEISTTGDYAAWKEFYMNSAVRAKDFVYDDARQILRFGEVKIEFLQADTVRLGITA